MKDPQDIINGFIAYLTSTGQLDLLPEIVKKLNLLTEEENETAHITSAVTLNDKEQEKIKEFLFQKFSKTYKIDIIVDSGVIGGIKIRVGDKVIDETLVTRLNSLAEKLSE